ncbi:MAG: TonB-dependent receptor, partial [Deltaproteobacteria bacterium]|nr:TonB-dependent receptor [Deltaproteobacteria bacterium]
EIGLGGAQDNDDDTLLFGLKDSVMVAAGSHHLLTFFALYQFESFSPENFMASPSAGDTSRRHTVNTGAGDEIDLLDHRLLITPSFWFENIFNSLNNNDPSLLVPATFANTDSEHHFSASLGVKGKVTSFLDLIAHAARSFRNPTFPELFGDRGGIVGNPLLDPQESINWDVGFQFHPPLEKGGRGDFLNDLFISSLYFDRRVTNLIQFQQNSGFARAENVGKARIQGMEIQGGAEFLNHFGLYGNYTFQIAKDWAKSGRTIPGQPKHELDTRLEGWWKKWKGTVSLNWMDSNFLDPLNTRVVRDRLLLNSALSFWPKDKIGVTVEAKNLADDQVVDVVGFPLPGRSFYAKADLRF